MVSLQSFVRNAALRAKQNLASFRLIKETCKMTCEEIIAAYFETIKEGVSCKETPNGRLSIVLPFLYPDHDNVEVYVKELADSIIA